MKRLLLVIYLVTAAVGVQAVKQYRDFTDTKGRTIRGRIVAYDAKKKIVTFERDNKRTSKVPITVFSETDQGYVLEWETLKNFATERLFRISAKQKKIDNEAKGSKSRSKQIEVEDTHYEILLENKSASELKGLELEYCIYYEQEEGAACSQGVHCGDLSIDAINPVSKKTLQTEAVSTYTKELNSDWRYVDDDGKPISVDNVQRGDVHGIWIRIHLKLPSGQKETREFCCPESISNSKAWVSSSIRAGMN